MDETRLIKKCFQCCLKCGKYIEDGEPHIIAYKYGVGEFFCKDHIDVAKVYLGNIQEYINTERIS